jgi:integrase/recombinase XerD
MIAMKAGPVIRPRRPSPIRPKPAITPELDALLTGWAMWMRGQGQRERTVEDCVGTLRRFAYLHGDPMHCTSSDVNAFLGRPIAPTTRAANFGQLRAFFQFMALSGRRLDHPMVGLRPPRVPRAVPRPITTGQLRTLLATPMHRRARTMVLLAAYQGLRVHEIAKVRGEDFDVENGTLRVAGKGGHVAVLPLHPIVADQVIYHPRSGYWFPSYIGNRNGDQAAVLSRSVSNVLSQAMARAGVPGSAHSLRHWFATELVRSGIDLRTTQTLMRHASIATTQRYVGIDAEQLTSAAIRLPYIDVDAAAPPTPNVEGERRRAFHARVGATPAQVRRWARENGWDVAQHGQLPWTVLEGYRAARNAHPALMGGAS